MVETRLFIGTDVEVDVAGVATGTLEAHDAIRNFDHVIGHGLHDDPIDVR